MISAAYYNWGRWVVDCPAGGCTDARTVPPGHPSMMCEQGHVFDVGWPPADLAAQVVAALVGREERHRSWFPAGHPLAVASGQPHGQSIDELHAETRWLNEQLGPADTRSQVRAAVEALGLEFDEATGTVRGL